MNTIEEFKALVTKYQTDKTLENALQLGDALVTLRKRTVENTSGDMREAEMNETKFLKWFNISNSTVRRLKLLTIWRREVVAENPGSLTDAYRIAEHLHKVALQEENAEVNRGGRPKKSDAERSLEFLQLAAEHWLASGRPGREFVDRAQMAVKK